MPPLKHHIRDLLPLLLRRVHTRRVMCTGVQEEDGACGGGAEVREEGGVGEAYCEGVVVWVVDWFDGDVFEDRVMVCWGGGREG